MESRDMMNAKQRAHLRSLAHHLKPILQMGKEGMTDATIGAVLALAGFLADAPPIAVAKESAAA